MWLGEVTALMPSVVVAARDQAGTDIVNVQVMVDGLVVSSRLDGKSIGVAPGEHVIRVVRDGGTGTPLEQKVLIREGEKARPLTFEFKADASPAPVVVAPVPKTKERVHTLPPWIVVGVGAATAITGAIIYVIDRNDIPSGCNFDARTCAPGSSPGVQNAAQLATSRANVGLIVGIVGLGVAGGGLVWHFLEPTGPVTTDQPSPSKSAGAASFTPVVAPGFAGGRISLAF